MFVLEAVSVLTYLGILSLNFTPQICLLLFQPFLVFLIYEQFFFLLSNPINNCAHFIFLLFLFIQQLTNAPIQLFNILAKLISLMLLPGLASLFTLDFFACFHHIFLFLQFHMILIILVPFLFSFIDHERVDRLRNVAPLGNQLRYRILKFLPPIFQFVQFSFQGANLSVEPFLILLSLGIVQLILQLIQFFLSCLNLNAKRCQLSLHLKNLLRYLLQVSFILVNISEKRIYPLTYLINGLLQLINDVFQTLDFILKSLNVLVFFFNLLLSIIKLPSLFSQLVLKLYDFLVDLFELSLKYSPLLLIHLNQRFGFSNGLCFLVGLGNQLINS